MANINKPQEDGLNVRGSFGIIPIMIKKERRKIFSSYMILGYNAATRSSKDSYVLDVIRSILGRGQSGKLFIEIRSKRGLAYEVGSHHEPGLGYGFFCVYAGMDKKNIKKA